MANKVKCNKCNHEFKINKGDDLKCPECDSIHVTLESGSFLQRRGGWLLAGLLIVAAIVFFVLRLYPLQGCNPPEIKEVKVDSINRVISISAKASSPGCKLSYSIDNNKTGAYTSSRFSNVPAGQYFVCVIYGDEPEDRVMWKNNPVIMPESDLDPSLSPPQVIGADIINPTADKLGEIVVHALFSCQIEYILNDSIKQKDSVFSRISPGEYIVSVKDSLGRIDRLSDPIFMPKQPKGENSRAAPCSNPDKSQLQDQINSLFNNQRGDQDLQNEILGKFASQKVTVTGKLINTSEKYTIYQYLYRQNVGLPGSIKVRVNNLRYNEFCKITYFEIEEYEN